MRRCYPRRPMRWNAAIGAIARCKRVSTGCGRKSSSMRVLRWICGVKLKPKAVNKPLHYFILHELDKPGSSATVSIDDTGNYQLTGPDGVVTLSWHYQVVRLWAMQAEELVAVGRPALLALVGQTHIEAPEVLLPQVVAQMRNVSDVEMRGRLLTALVALISQEEIIAMVERLL